MMANHMDPPWLLSARIPGNGVPRFSMETSNDGYHRQNPDAMPALLNTDPRVLFATRFWDRRRRFSDSASQLPHQALTTHSLRHLDFQNGNEHRALEIPDHRPRAPQLPPTPTSTHSVPPPSPRPLPHHHQTQTSSAADRYTPTHTPPKPKPAPQQKQGRAQPQPQGFLHFPGYTPHPIHPRRPIPIATRREELVNALAEIEAKSGPVTIKGAGHLARPLLLGNNSSGAAVLNHFLDYGERTLLVPQPSSSLKLAGGEGEIARKINQRELVRLESEVFDTEKYSHAGGGAVAKNLTVVTWSEDSRYGTITLFEVDMVDAGHTPTGVAGGLTGLAARRRHAPPMLDMLTRRERERVVAVRPVAAMEDVPRQVLVNMRVDYGIRKAVLQRGKGSERFRWMVQHTRRGLPCHARLWDAEGGCDVRTATGTGFDDGWGRSTRRSRRRDAKRRERSSLRVEDARDIAQHATDTNHIPPDADGMVATIPQCLALLHVSRSIVEKALSTLATTQTVETENGERLRAVSLGDAPKGTRHRGREVHVVVLVPHGAKWAEERIFWTGDAGALSELRQKKYRDVIDRRKTRKTRGKGAYDSEWDVKSMGSLSPLSPPLGPRSARW